MARGLAWKRLWRRWRVAGQPGLLCSGLCFPTRNLNQIQCNPTRKSQRLPSVLSATFLWFLNCIHAGWERQSLWEVEVERLGLAQGQQPQTIGVGMQLGTCLACLSLGLDLEQHRHTGPCTPSFLQGLTVREHGWGTQNTWTQHGPLSGPTYHKWKWIRKN